MIKKFIRYSDCTVYALYYRSNNTIYYNKNFCGTYKLIIFK